MKKLFGLLIGVLILTGCESVKGDYKEGTYYGTTLTESYGSKYVASAVVYVDKSGSIKSVFIDSTYFKDEIYTTKKTLGDKYGMKETSASLNQIKGGSEWYEQVKVLEEKIVKEQGTKWVKYKDDNTTLDAISGCTIAADKLIEAVNNALEQAKK